MPYPNEHAARQQNPSRYKTFRRGPVPGAPGVSAIWGILPSGKTEIQSLRFNRTKFTVDQAKAWLKRNHFKTNVEQASGEAKA